MDDYGSLGQIVKPSIYRVPEFMREVHPKAFEPQLVSFGPYHHGKPQCASMELEKQKAFRRFKTENGEKLEPIVKTVSQNLENLLGAYDKLEDEWKKHHAKFLEVLIVDGCFMLSFFENCPPSLSSMSWDIKRDMLLLENQLPMQLLQDLHSILENMDGRLTWFICKSMCIKLEEEVSMGEDLHILDMYRMSLLGTPIENKDGSRERKTKKSGPEYQVIRHATQLREAGIGFQQSGTKSLTDVSFDSKKGVLKIPYLVVDDDSEANLLNVMAFEKLHEEAGSQVTSFVVLMNNLIDVDEDVALLSSKNILANALGDDQSAAELFGSLGKGVAMDLESHITEVHHLVNLHCRRPWNAWCASLEHNYFHNPWAIISLVAAILGFALLIVQAVYQIFDYYRRNEMDLK
ncbi:unnamed protein product [Citrullus colocynthis]|uniref:Uncharacterized protein n=1 Tax=Citrullus colocynthis TaxID=252529 RepID=A0ABP0ZCP9_9ROSI